MIRIFITLSVFFICPSIFGQTQIPDKCDHRNNSIERFEDIRLLPALKISNYDPLHVEVVYGDKNGLAYKSLKMRPDSSVPKSVDKNKWYWILYSQCDDTIEDIVPVLPGQLK